MLGDQYGQGGYPPEPAGDQQPVPPVPDATQVQPGYQPADTGWQTQYGAGYGGATPPPADPTTIAQYGYPQDAQTGQYPTQYGGGYPGGPPPGTHPDGAEGGSGGKKAFLIALAVILVIAALAAGYLLGRGGKKDTTTSTTSTPTASPTQSPTPSPTQSPSPTASPSPSRTASPSPSPSPSPTGNKAGTPEEAAQRLYAAWKANSRSQAAPVATQAAIDQLFSRGWSPPDMAFMGCAVEGPSRICSYLYEGGALVMTVNGGASAGWKVDSINYVAD